MALTGGAIAMLLFASFILYGGLLYFMLIALQRDPIMMLPDPLRGFFMVPWNRYGTVVLVALILIIPALTSEGIDEDGGYSGGPSGDEIKTLTTGETGDLDEGEDDSYEYNQGFVMEAWFNLTWSDESPPIGRTNEPDEFRLEVIAPNGETESESGSNSQGGDGSISIGVDVDGNMGGDWEVVVTMVEAGDNTEPTGLFTVADNGNDYDLDLWFKYVN